jgi:hypothetical protein
MYQDIAYDFKNQCTGKNFDSHAIKLANDNLISRIISGHKINPHFHPSLNTNIAFAELPIEMNGKNVLDNQPFYFLTNETDFHTCHNCGGDKYVPCPERECGGRHDMIAQSVMHKGSGLVENALVKGE